MGESIAGRGARRVSQVYEYGSADGTLPERRKASQSYLLGKSRDRKRSLCQTEHHHVRGRGNRRYSCHQLFYRSDGTEDRFYGAWNGKTFYADLNEDFYEPLKIAANANASKISQIQIRQKVNYTDSVRHYCEKYVSDEYKKRFAASLDRKYLIKELSQADRFVFRYQSTPNMAGHRYFEVQIIRINQEKFDGKVIVAFHHIDDIVTKEQTYQLELEKTAYQDALTGIGNRSAFTKEMQTYGENPEAACIVADVNNLKLQIWTQGRGQIYCRCCRLYLPWL